MSTDSQKLLDLTAARSLIQGRLLDLEASGHEGFEGFIRDALCEFTGIPMRLAKAGPQDGVDGSSNSVRSALAIGMEAKRYKPSSSLKLDDLKSKLGDAADRVEDPIDLWVIATSKELSANDVPKLKQKGDRLGVGVIVLEWREHGNSLSSLQLLLTQTPNSISAHLPGEEIANAVEVLVENASNGEIQHLRAELLEPNLGFATTASYMAQTLEKALSKRANAKAMLGSPTDILADNVSWASRNGPLSQLSTWKSGAANAPIAIVHGDEGAGKTAVVMDWVHRELQNASPPLVVFTPAKDLLSNRLADVIAHRLFLWTEHFDEAYWKRRLAQWRKFHRKDDKKPSILLVLDGLNEGDRQQLATGLFSDILSDDWRGFVGIVGTDRSGHWQRRFRGRFDTYGHTTEIEIGQFTLDEIDNLLASADMQRSDFPNELVEIIRWPSWYGVAASMFEQDVEWKIYTREQLMVEYWTRRSSALDRIGSPQAEQFREFVSSLGRRALQSGTDSALSRSELTGLLSEITGEPEKTLHTVVQDIVEGVWMTALAPNKIEVSEQLLPFAVALALLDELANAGSFEEADACCERALGPFEDRDIGVSILKAAAVLSTSLVPTSDHVRSVLFLNWAIQHNFKGWHFDIFWKSARGNTDIVLEGAKRCWLAQRGGPSTDEILVKAIVNLADENNEAFSAVITFVEIWFGKYWLDPHEGLYLGQPEEGSKERRIQTEARTKKILKAYNSDGGENSSIAPYRNGKDAGWLNHRLFAVLSYLPRARFIKAFENWTVSRAILNETHGFKDLAWSLRFNQQDAHVVRKEVLSLAKKLSKIECDFLSNSTRSLLLAEGSVEAANLADALFPQSKMDSASIRAAYEVKSAEITLPENFYSEQRHDYFTLANLALDPSLKIPQDAIAHILDFAKNIDPNLLSIGRSPTSEDSDYSNVLQIASRWKPAAVSDLAKLFVGSLSSRDDDGRLWGFAHHISRYLLFIDPATRSVIESEAKRRLEDFDSEDGDVVFFGLMSSSLFGLDAREQIAVWQRVGIPEKFNLDFKRVQNPFFKEDFAAVEPYLMTDNDVSVIVGWLRVLASAGSESEFPKHWKALSALFSHKDAEVRHAAFDVALDTRDPWFGLQLLDADWNFANEEGELTVWYGSLLLASAVNPSNFDEIAKRLEPKVTSTLWETLDFGDAFAQPFREFVDASVDFELTHRGSRSFGGMTYYHKEALAHLIEIEPDKHKEYTQRLFKESRYLDMTLNDWPIREYLQFYGESDPDYFVSLWEVAEKRMRDGFVNRPGLSLWPFQSRTCERVNALRNQSIISCTSDNEIARIANRLTSNELVDWAVDWAERHILDAVDAAMIARAVTLVGYLAPTERVQEFWKSGLIENLSSGWLAEVKSRAIAEHEKMLFLAHWLEKLTDSKDDQDVFSNWLLVEALTESHSLPIVFDAIDKPIREAVSARQFSYLAIAFSALAQKHKSKNSGSSNELFFTQKGPRTAQPWSS
mgnify:CR=1 FL=1